MRRKAISIVLAAAMAVTMTPWQAMQGAVYADEQSTVTEVTEQATVADAERQLKDCIEARDQAKTARDEAEKVLEEASGECEDASEVVEQKQTAYDDAKQDLDNANEELAAADQTLKEAVAKEKQAEADLETATGTLAEKKTAEKDAEASVTEAESDLTLANTQWEAEQKQAKEDLEAAQEEYDNAGYNFINTKVDAMGSKYYNLDEIIANEKNSSYGPVTAWDESTQLTMSQIVNDEYFESILREACSYDNLKLGIDFIKHTNELRMNARHNLSELGVNYQLVANGLVSSAVASYAQGHNLIGSSNYAYWTIDTPTNYRPRNEDLAYATSPVGNSYDPFDGWYYEERIVWLGQQGNGVTQDIIDQVIKEAQDDGSNFNPYRRYSKAAYLQRMQNNSVTGHYLAIIEPKLTAMGAGHTYTSQDYVKSLMEFYYSGYKFVYYTKAALEFNNTTKNILSVSDYEGELESWFASYKDALSAAQDRVTELESAPDYVTSAQQALTNARATLATAQTEVKDAETALDEAETALTKAEGELTDAETAQQTAADVQKTAADNEQKAKGELEEAEQGLKEKRTAKDTAEDAFNDAKETLKKAEDDVDSAQAIYDAFFKLENAVAEAIKDQVYTGSEIKPDVKIKNKGETVDLVKGTDFTLSYEDNTNVGAAKVKAEGQGDYSGTLETTFKITPAAISSADIAAIADQMNTGSALTPVPELTFNGSALTADKDFEVAYENNTEVGTATVTIEGKGNFTGTRTATFEIVKNDGGYSQLPAKEQSTVSSIASRLGLETAEAMEVYNYAKAAGVLADTLMVTEAALTKGNTDSDVKGAHFTPLNAKAGKVTKKAITLKWTKFPKADGYKIYGNLCGKTKKCKLLKKITNKNATSFTQKKLKKGKYYKYVVVAYKKIDGKEITVAATPTIHAATLGGKVGNDKKVTTKAKKNKVTLKVKKTFKLKAKAVPAKKKMKVKKHRAIAYASSNTAVATVSAKGVIKGAGKGTCYVYAYAQNGVFAKIKVTVK